MTGPAFAPRAVLVAVLAMLPACAIAAEPVRLITREEAGLPMVASAGGGYRNMTRGPGIDKVAPAAVGLNSASAFRLAVRFKPRNGVPIDPATVRVTYQRDPKVDLTARLKPFVSPEGIEAAAVLVPPGKHVIEIEATDKEGRTGRAQMTLTVEGEQ